MTYFDTYLVNFIEIYIEFSKFNKCWNFTFWKFLVHMQFNSCNHPIPVSLKVGDYELLIFCGERGASCIEYNESIRKILITIILIIEF